MTHKATDTKCPLQAVCFIHAQPEVCLWMSAIVKEYVTVLACVLYVCFFVLI